LYKILLVDDEELERKVLGFTLQNSGLPVIIVGEAASGREALEEVRRTTPDLIIMDIKMPGIDGIEATRRIKEIYPVTEVIILSAYGKFSYSQQAIKAQASDYLLKPVQPQQLVEAVKKVLDKLSRKKFQPGPALDLAEFEEQVKLGSLEEGNRQLQLLLDRLVAREPNPSPALLTSFGLRLMVISVQAILSAGADPDEVPNLESELTQDLSRVSSCEELEVWSYGMLEKCIRLLRSRHAFNDQAMVRKAMEYIEHNFASDISLNLVAAKVHLSPAYLSRIFTKKIGISLTEYLTKVRLKEAKKCLRTTDWTIDQIAAVTGFSSNSYFAYVFKKYEGVTPSEYRTKHE